MRSLDGKVTHLEHLTAGLLNNCYEAAMILRAILVSFLFITAEAGWGFAPDFDRHVQLTPTNVAAYGMSVSYSPGPTNGYVLVHAPQEFGGAPFDHAMFKLSEGERSLMIPVEARRSDEKLVVKFWLDPRSVSESELTLRYWTQGSREGVRFHIALGVFMENNPKPHNHSM